MALPPRRMWVIVTVSVVNVENMMTGWMLLRRRVGLTSNYLHPCTGSTCGRIYVTTITTDGRKGIRLLFRRVFNGNTVDLLAASIPDLRFIRAELTDVQPTKSRMTISLTIREDTKLVPPCPARFLLWNLSRNLRPLSVKRRSPSS